MSPINQGVLQLMKMGQFWGAWYAAQCDSGWLERSVLHPAVDFLLEHVFFTVERAFKPMIQFGLSFRQIKTNFKLNILKTSGISVPAITLTFSQFHLSPLTMFLGQPM